MNKGEYYYEFNISESQRELARSRAEAEKKDVHSEYTIDPNGIYTGYIGEVVFNDLFPAARYHTEHKDKATKYDFILEEHKIDVKTSRIKEGVERKPHWRGYNMPSYIRNWWQIDGETDYYVFCDVNHDYTKLYMYGMVPCEDFFLHAEAKSWPDNRMSFSLRYKQMFEMSVLPLYESDMDFSFEES